MRKPYFKAPYLSKDEAKYLRSLLDAQGQHESKNNENVKKSLSRKLGEGWSELK